MIIKIGSNVRAGEAQPATSGALATHRHTGHGPRSVESSGDFVQGMETIS